MRKTCVDQTQNLPRRQLWHYGLLGRCGLSYFGLGQEFRCAYNGHVKVVVGAILKQGLLESGVRKMSAVPRQEIIHPVDDSESNMCRIHLCLLGQLQKLDDGIRQGLNPGSKIKLWNARHNLQPPGSSLGIALGNLCPDSNGRVKAKPHPLVIPPILCDLLMRRHRLLMAAVRCQVAGNGRLNIHCLHNVEPVGRVSAKSWIANADIKPKQWMRPGGTSCFP